VDWVLEALAGKLNHGCFERQTGYPKAFIESLMLKDIKSIMETWCKSRQRVNTEEYVANKEIKAPSKDLMAP
jgi:hypothetical protein